MLNNINMKRSNNINSHVSPNKKKFNSLNNFKDISLQRRELPAYKMRRRLLSEIEKNSTLIIIGETGCGKTTQIPQLIYEVKLAVDGIIGVTQPRRVAAITIAYRVSQEMNSVLGDKVGYSVRFEDVTCANTKIKYLTDGMLLRESISDKHLKNYSVIILDEAHERSVNTDILFGIVKKAQLFRSQSQMKPLKIIIMSATMDVDHFSNYFNAPVVYLEGRQFQVKIYHTEESQEDYLMSSLITIFKIHRETPKDEDILVFLTGQDEIEAMAKTVRKLSREPNLSEFPGMKVFTLFAALASSKQLEVFSPSTNSRKVILSTNIAETSVTIPNIKHVIDTGMVKSRLHIATTGLDMLKIHTISKAQAWQRTGRTGRDCAGSCYRLYTTSEFEEMIDSTIPEILRCNLSSIVLQLLALDISAIDFDFLDKPPQELLQVAYKDLIYLEAITKIEDEYILTSTGKSMSIFPLDPKYSKIILTANQYGCLQEILSIISLLSGESVFVKPNNKDEKFAQARLKFNSNSGDHITLLNIYKAFSAETIKYSFCYDNFLNSRNLEYSTKVRKQLLDLCEKMKFQVTSCGSDLDKVRKCLISGLFTNVAKLQRDKKYITILGKQTVSIHPSSVLYGTYPPLLLYSELVQTGKSYIRHLTPIDEEWFFEVAPKEFLTAIKTL